MMLCIGLGLTLKVPKGITITITITCGMRMLTRPRNARQISQLDLLEGNDFVQWVIVWRYKTYFQASLEKKREGCLSVGWDYVHTLTCCESADDLRPQIPFRWEMVPPWAIFSLPVCASVGHWVCRLLEAGQSCVCSMEIIKHVPKWVTMKNESSTHALRLVI